MRTQKFTLLQLFSVVDGRLSTTDDDVITILSHLMGVSIVTGEIPEALVFLRKCRPLWFAIIEDNVRTLKVMYEEVDDFTFDWFGLLRDRNRLKRFRKLIDNIERHYNVTFDVPELLPHQQQEWLKIRSV